MDTGWLLDSGNWYWLDISNGNMCTCWQNINDIWYQADPDTGICSQDTVLQIGSEQYAFNSSCAIMNIGWGFAGGKWYWAGQSGALESNWNKIDGQWY